MNYQISNEKRKSGASIVTVDGAFAKECVSKRDFKFSISRCVKEAKETKLFLRAIVASEPQLAERARPIYKEAHELLRIFASMRHKQ